MERLCWGQWLWGIVLNMKSDRHALTQLKVSHGSWFENVISLKQKQIRQWWLGGCFQIKLRVIHKDHRLSQLIPLEILINNGIPKKSKKKLLLEVQKFEKARNIPFDSLPPKSTDLAWRVWVSLTPTQVLLHPKRDHTGSLYFWWYKQSSWLESGCSLAGYFSSVLKDQGRYTQMIWLAWWFPVCLVGSGQVGSFW